MNEITIGDKIYISAKRAAEITGYARDYVGQLCREGHIDAKMVGRSWYVYEPSIRAHRFGEVEAAEPATVQQPSSELPAVDNATASQQSAGAWEQATYTAETPDILPEIQAPSIEELLPPAEESLTDMQTAWREWFEQKQKTFETPEIESPEIIDARNEALEAEDEPLVAEEEDEADLHDENVEASAEEVSIPLHRIAEAPLEHLVVPDDEEVVEIRHIAPVPQAPVYTYPAPHMDIAPEPAPSYMQPIYAEPVARYSREEALPEQHQGRIVEERVIPATVRQGKRARKGGKSSGSNAPIIAALIAISIVSVTIAAIGTGYAGRYLKQLPANNNPVINFLIGTREYTR